MFTHQRESQTHQNNGRFSFHNSSITTVSDPDPRIRNSNGRKSNLSEVKEEDYNPKIKPSSSYVYSQISNPEVRSAKKEESMKIFENSNIQRNRQFDENLDGSLRIGSNVQKMSVKNRIEQNNFDFWRFCVEFFAILFLVAFGYKGYTYLFE